MARLVDEPFMDAIETLLENDTALADTLALMLDEEAMGVIQQGQKEWKRGEKIPLKDILK